MAVVELDRTYESEPDVLLSLCEVFEEAAKHVQLLTNLIARGSTPVLSIDLCELVDYAVPFGTQNFSGEDVLERRRVITDIRFGQRCLEAVLEGKFAFTLLPGTASEIIYFMRSCYSRNAALMRMLESAVAEESLEVLADYPESIVRPEVQQRVENLLRVDALGLVSADRFVNFVVRLLRRNNFFPVAQLSQGIEIDRRRFESLMYAMGSIRGGYGELNNAVDAFNVAFAAAVSDSEGLSKVVHVTRTPTLHRISQRSDLKIDLTIRLAGGAQVPLICKPQVIFLLDLLMREFSAQRDDNASLVRFTERFYRHLVTAVSLLREYAELLRTGSTTDERQSVLGQLYRGDAGEARNVWRFVNEYVYNCMHAEQLLDSDLRSFAVDRDAQLSMLQSQRLQLDVLRRQEELSEAVEIVRHLGSVDASWRSAKVGPPLEMLSRPLTLLEGAGFRLDYRRDKGIEGARVVVRAGEEDFFGESMAGGLELLGLQEFSIENVRIWNLYWPTTQGLQRFLRSIQAVFRGNLQVSVLSTSGEIDYFELGSAQIAPASLLLRQTRARPIRVIKIERGNVLCVCEVLSKKRRPMTSVRMTNELDEKLAARLYSEASGRIAPDLVEDFVRQHVRRGNIHGN